MGTKCHKNGKKVSYVIFICYICTQKQNIIKKWSILKLILKT